VLFYGCVVLCVIYTGFESSIIDSILQGLKLARGSVFRRSLLPEMLRFFNFLDQDFMTISWAED
jgi:hypothetical protein